MLTDNDMLDYGRYKFIRLRNVPADYLITISKQDPKVLDYVNANLDKLMERRKEMPFANPEPPVCTKITYVNEKEAKRILKIARHKKQNNKRPIRAYECNVCGGWHLTSKPLIKDYSK